MSYRLITKASFTLSGNATREVDVRAYAAPKGASVGTITLNGAGDVSFKLTGGQGRGAVVRSYMYFTHKGESAYIEITRDEFTALKAGGKASVDTITIVAPQGSSEVIEGLATVEEAPKATRKGRKQAA